MFEIKITKTVKNKLIDYYKEKLSYPIHSWSIDTFEYQSLQLIEQLDNIFGELGFNPFQYPLLTKNSRVIVDIYLPYFLIYKIIDNKVIIFNVIFSSPLS